MNFHEEVKSVLSLSLNENGEVKLLDEIVISVTNDVFDDLWIKPIIFSTL